ncbi:MAG: indolepyruvate ferredoxin oxidoreductase subunit alpha [Deferrisomatales bacterium]|nr:indolepyruvate ferredoxin oxidoreductase subunit alpha [Deferrisomatales bacterium]
MTTHLLSGNEAIARGIYEAGVTVASGYPGTPSTEILEAVSRFKGDIYCEWSPNEKVAFEVAAGAALAGARAVCTMKHVGLNVAADPLMTLSYIGTVGGFVACVADDPGQHSSQNEQDTRHYARFAKIPIFEPADSQEAKESVALALDVSERFDTPVILRTTTRVSHSRGLVRLGERIPPRTAAFERNPPRYVPIPIWGRKMRVKVEERLGRLAEEASRSRANRIEWADRGLGIVAVGVAYGYVKEIFPEASILKLSWCYPFPDALLREFAAGVEQVLVVEELDDIVEEHVKALGIPCRGKDVVARIGELSAGRLRESRARLEGSDPATVGVPLADEAQDLPGRPPVLCPGCPHRGVFHGLGKLDVVVTGDIGCYSLGVFPPLSRTDTILCMGAGITMAHGMDKAGEPRKVVGIVGDSTFFHSGITGLLDIAYNRGSSTIIVVDNRTTAMTGHQDHPGTGRTLMGEPTGEASIEDLGRACGIRRVVTVDPYDLKATAGVLKAEVEAPEPSLVVSRAPCPLHTRSRLGPARWIDAETCVQCGNCVKLGCPAIESDEESVRINELLCLGCGMCEQVCRPGAVWTGEGDRG